MQRVWVADAWRREQDRTLLERRWVNASWFALPARCIDGDDLIGKRRVAKFLVGSRLDIDANIRMHCAAAARSASRTGCSVLWYVGQLKDMLVMSICR